MMVVFTTINPFGNFEAQDEALKSWSEKYDVYSINPYDEIELAKTKFPYINFIGTDDIYLYGKKKLVKLNAILNGIKIVKPKTCAIVNSDIILDGNLKLDKYIKDGLVISTRWELDGVKKIYPFVNGYDLFIFDYKYIDIFYNNNYVIGMPWWDFWIPLIANKCSLRVYHIKNDVIYHRTHETNYDDNIWVKFGEYLYKDIMVNIMKNYMEITVWEFCTGVKKYIELKQKNIKI